LLNFESNIATTVHAKEVLELLRAETRRESAKRMEPGRIWLILKEHDGKEQQVRSPLSSQHGEDGFVVRDPGNAVVV
jgi:hypothetical protein